MPWDINTTPGNIVPLRPSCQILPLLDPYSCCHDLQRIRGWHSWCPFLFGRLVHTSKNNLLIIHDGKRDEEIFGIGNWVFWCFGMGFPWRFWLKVNRSVRWLRQMLPGLLSDQELYGVWPLRCLFLSSSCRNRFAFPICIWRRKFKMTPRGWL